MNTEIIKLENTLVSILNGSLLPLEVKRLIVADLYEKVKTATIEAVRKEELEKRMQESEKKKKEVEKEKGVIADEQSA